MKRMENKVAVITGGNSGIGKGIADKFVQEGAKVVIFGRNKETLEGTKQELPGVELAIQGDVTKAEDLQNLYAEVVKRYGKMDVLVANAGVSKRYTLEEAGEEEFDHIVGIDYRGLFFTVKYALPLLKENSSVLLIASVAAHDTARGHSIYCSAKAAVVKLAQNFALELAERKVRVNSISPGYTQTPIFDGRIAKEPGYLEARRKEIPLQRIGQPEDIANAALFLASEEASYITGSDLVVDGGLILT